MADDKSETFMQSFLGKILESFCLSKKLDIQIPPEWVEENGWVPNIFIIEIARFHKPFSVTLIKDVLDLPVLLFASEDFFKRFAHSVCLKLIEGEVDDRTAFLKVTAFLLAITTSAFVFDCFRAIYEIPLLYCRMLRDHLRTKFYIEDKFVDMALKCRELSGDAEWISNTVLEMRRLMEETRDVELPATIIYPDSFQQKISKFTLRDLREQSSDKSDSDTVQCKYCGMNCLLALKVFFQPRIKHKPDVPQK